jgi:hypothetical protein
MNFKKYIIIKYENEIINNNVLIYTYCFKWAYNFFLHYQPYESPHKEMEM